MAGTTDTTRGQLAGCSHVCTTQPWQLGIVADGCGRTHLVALVTDTVTGTRRRVDLLAPLGDDQVNQVRADVVHTFDAEQLTTLYDLVERHVADEPLRRGLTQLITHATNQAPPGKMTP